MKLGKITLTPPIGAISAFFLSVFACGSLFGAAKTFYVSTNDLHEVDGVVWGTYITDDGVAHNAYTNLQQAVNASASGDTIWVENNFICDTGTYSDNNGVGRLYVGMAITLRGRSGDGHTGPVIRGNRLAPTNCPSLTACGADSVRCLVLRYGAKIIGFRLENGATANVSNGTKGDAGGAWAYFDATLENCVITNCVGARNGGGAWGCTLMNCELVDNYGRNGGGCAQCTGSGLNIHHNAATCYGGGASDCTLSDSTIATNFVPYSGTYLSSHGGGVYKGTYTHCTIVSNATSKTNSHGVNERGGGAFQASLIDCTVTNNYAYQLGGGTYGCTVEGGRIVGNYVEKNGGGDSSSTLYNVLVKGNYAKGVGGGIHASCGTNVTITANSAPVCGGALSARLSDSFLTNNMAVMTGAYGSGSNGGFRSGSYTNCVIANNTAVGKAQAGYCGGGGGGMEGNSKPLLYNCLITNNVADARGGGVSDAILYNCIVMYNRAGSTGGGGLWNTTAYNTLIAFNTTSSGAGSAADMYNGTSELYNCTIVSNGVKITNAFSIGGSVGVHNCIEFGDGKNGGGKSPEYSCFPGAQEGVNGNTAVNPRLTTVDGKLFAPKARQCHGTAQVYDWMTDSTMFHSKDWYGDPRILGDGPDMGWVSLKKMGLILLLR